MEITGALPGASRHRTGVCRQPAVAVTAKSAPFPEHLGDYIAKDNAVHDSLLLAIETVLREVRCLTRDMGGTGNTADLGQAIVDAIS